MMKKYSLIAALVIALTFAFVGCSGTLPDDNSGNQGGNNGGATADTWERDIVAELGTGGEYKPDFKQTQYSDGAQLTISAAGLMGGKKISTGDEYEIELEFTIDRVPTTDIFVFFVQNDPNDWVKLTSPDATMDKTTLSDSVKNTPAKLTLTATATAKAATAASNKLIFETKEGKKPVDVDDIEITFTKFILKKTKDGTFDSSGNQGGNQGGAQKTPLELLQEMAGGITIGVAGSGTAFDATTKVLTVSGGTSALFYITEDFSDAASKSIKITYACVIDSGLAKVVVKQGANSWTDLGGDATNADKYPTLTGGGVSSVLTVNGDYLTSATNGISFQHNADGGDNSDAKYYVKILSVVIE